MSTLLFVDHVSDDAELDHSRITDLAIVDGFLISTTRYDGVLQSWQIGPANLATIDSTPFDGGNQPGGTATIGTVTFGADSGLLTGGGTGGDLQTRGLNSDGTFAAASALTTLPASFAGFQHGTQISFDDGTQIIYGGIAGIAGIGQLSFDAGGTFTGQQVIHDGATGYADQVATTAAARIDGQDYLFTANPLQNGVTSWAVGADGSTVATDHINPDDGLWISAPSAMEIAVVGGITYAILGAAGSSTLSVMEVGLDGSLTMRDHVLDSLTTRFGGITSLDVVTHQGQTYVIAGGADDGVSVFALLEGGHLLARAHIEDSNDMSFDNVSALAVQGRGNGLDIYVASTSEIGVTQLRYDAGLPGVTHTAAIGGGLLVGTAGNDILQGHNGNDQISAGTGDDILRDGDGSDTMTGGAGTDTFILSRDGLTDTITDFTLGEDKLDLSLWPLLRDVSQLTFSIQSYGMDVAYGDELLIVRSADGNFIDYRLLDNDDVIGAGTRISTVIEPGYPGPATPPPDPNPTPPPGDDAGTVGSLADGIAVISGHSFGTLRDALAGKGNAAAAQTTGGDTVISGTMGNDAVNGGDGIDIISAGAGNDIVRAGGGDDILLGRAGNDNMDGETGGDLIMGGAGNDHLKGGSGQDVLHGGDDDDRLAGGAGDDILFGDAGADSFIFNGGTDLIADYEQGVDDIELDASLWTGLTSAQDVLTVYGQINGTEVTIDLGDGNILQINGVTDFNTLATDIALF